MACCASSRKSARAWSPAAPTRPTRRRWKRSRRPTARTTWRLSIRRRGGRRPPPMTPWSASSKRSTRASPRPMPRSRICAARPRIWRAGGTKVQQVRDRFRSAGYDHPYAGFDNDNAIADALKQVLAGAAGGILWDLLRGGYSYRGPRGQRDAGLPELPFPFPIPGGGGQGIVGRGMARAVEPRRLVTRRRCPIGRLRRR